MDILLESGSLNKRHIMPWTDPFRSKAIASRVKALASKVKAIASRVKALASRVKA
jgi:outer membrane murein-binding lipoprotein Lpp